MWAELVSGKQWSCDIPSLLSPALLLQVTDQASVALGGTQGHARPFPAQLCWQQLPGVLLGVLESSILSEMIELSSIKNCKPKKEGKFIRTKEAYCNSVSGGAPSISGKKGIQEMNNCWNPSLLVLLSASFFNPIPFAFCKIASLSF